MKLKKEYKYLIIFIIGVLLIYIYRHLFIYSYTLNKRWNINLTSNYGELEVVKENNGINYRVFKYDKIDKNTWGIKFTKKDKETKYYSKYSECMDEYLNYINIKNYKCKNCSYYYKYKDNNELILILDKKKKRLYVIENLLEEA